MRPTLMKLENYQLQTCMEFTHSIWLRHQI
jgi:hypothetical protein